MRKGTSDIEQKKLLLNLLEEMSEPNRPEVEAWMDRDAQNFDTDAAWENFSGRMGNEKRDFPTDFFGSFKWGQTGVRGIILQVLGTAAAVLMLGLFTVVITNYLKDRSDAKPVVMASASVATQDTLSDGTAIVLNSNSTLTHPKKFSESDRTVKLVGEAFFDVTPDTSKPFVIHAGEGQIRVLGTSFHVKAFPNSDLEVYVESGKVEVTFTDSLSGSITRRLLLPGEKALVNHLNGAMTMTETIVPDELFWVNRKLIFRETQLAVVFDLLKTHYSARIEVRNEDILTCLLSATFNNEAIDQILEVIAASFELNVNLVDGIFVIDGNGCHHEE